MRNFVIVLIAVFFSGSSFNLFADENNQQPTDTEKVFVEKYVKAINEKDEEQLKQSVLVDNQTMNTYFPLEFGFRLSDPEPMGNLRNPDLSISLGYSQMGDHSMAISSWKKLQGNKLKSAIYNKNSSLEDQFHQSGEITLASYATSDDKREFTSTIKIKYENQEE